MLSLINPDSWHCRDKLFIPNRFIRIVLFFSRLYFKALLCLIRCKNALYFAHFLGEVLLLVCSGGRVSM